MGTLAFGEALVGALGGHLTGSGKRAPRKRRSGAPHPTGAPVLRDSVEEGTFEHLFFTAPAKGRPTGCCAPRVGCSMPGASCGAKRGEAQGPRLAPSPLSSAR
ncbi:hypothetical protein [Sphingobium xenophagum]|uniref:hypothetical protein n=1 Tax=Sphingobium xenophagum TaxID=121428 RepID=UPI001FD62A5C|nr:hypothetical protein [Sphingobium xenophagum]